MDEILAKLKYSVTNLQACFDILRSLRVKIYSEHVTKTLSRTTRVDILPDKKWDLSQSIRCLYTFSNEEVEEIGVTDIFGPLTSGDLRISMSIEIVQLVLKQVNLVLARHDVFPFLCLFFTLAGHWCEIVVHHVK